jgi:hypothetical protein
MELLLNLVWLMLALPAIWLWRREAVRPRRLDRLRSVLLLSCILVLLFPVISATDDLHAMRAEMEESSLSKRTVKQSAGENSSGWLAGAGAASAQLHSRSSLCPGNQACGHISAHLLLLPEQAYLGTRPCRAPPLAQIS